MSQFPRVWTIPYNLACYCAQLGRLDECKDWFKQAMALDTRTVQLAALDDPDLKPLWDSMSGTMWKQLIEFALFDAPRSRGSGFLERPSSKLAWWSVGLTAICLLAILILVSGAFKHAATHTPMKTCGLVMVRSGIASGVTSMLAMLRRRESSWLLIVPIIVDIILLVIIAEIAGLI